jgi:hypothetical protein
MAGRLHLDEAEGGYCLGGDGLRLGFIMVVVNEDRGVIVPEDIVTDGDPMNLGSILWKRTAVLSSLLDLPRIETNLKL